MFECHYFEVQKVALKFPQPINKKNAFQHQIPNSFQKQNIGFS